MGSGMARNFITHGYQVFGWNRSNKTPTFPELSQVTYCQSPAEVARKSEVVFEVTAHDESSKAVWTGPDGILQGANHTNTLITSATLSVRWTDELSRLCQERTLDFFDIPLTGGRIGAETGSLTLLCGGEKDKLDSLNTTFEAIAKKVMYLGPVGHGMRYKLILNFLQALHIVGYGQAMRMARAHDMDLHAVGEALCDRPGGVITQIAHNSYFQEPDPITFSIDWITKDLSYAQQMAAQLEMPLLNDVLTEYQNAVENGLGQKDWTSITTIKKDSEIP